VLLLLLVKLALAQYSIEITALSRAFVGALIAAKAALVLDETPLARALERYRRIVAVAVKTFLYGIAFLLMGYLERVVEALHKTHEIGGAIGYVVDHASQYRLLGWALGVSIIFALYFSFAEISRYMGKGALANSFSDRARVLTFQARFQMSVASCAEIESQRLTHTQESNAGRDDAWRSSSRPIDSARY
jgi:hypothetical protein